jgi:hypothetical protein
MREKTDLLALCFVQHPRKSLAGRAVARRCLFLLFGKFQLKGWAAV